MRSENPLLHVANSAQEMFLRTLANALRLGLKAQHIILSARMSEATNESDIDLLVIIPILNEA